MLTVARIVRDLGTSGYKLRRVWMKVKRFVCVTAAWRYGETNPMFVFALIYHQFCVLTRPLDPPPFGLL